MLRFLLNVLWFVLGGVVMGLGWWLAGLVAAVTIDGLWQSGREVANRPLKLAKADVCEIYAKRVLGDS